MNKAVWFGTFMALTYAPTAFAEWSCSLAALVNKPKALLHIGETIRQTQLQRHSDMVMVPSKATFMYYTLGKQVCAAFPDAPDTNSTGFQSGLLTLDDLRKIPSRTGASDWGGNWEFLFNSITFSHAQSTLTASGSAAWIGKSMVRSGNFQGKALLNGNQAVFYTGTPCFVRTTKFNNMLVVADNMQCGGLNVSFNGIYTQKPSNPEKMLPPDHSVLEKIETDWGGTWRAPELLDLQGTLSIAKSDTGNTFLLHGKATWSAKGYVQHGQIAGKAKLTGNALIYTDKNGCTVRFHKVGNTLTGQQRGLCGSALGHFEQTFLKQKD